MKIAGYLQTSLIEWPGKIASVIFVPACNFCCPFCHNRDLVTSNKSAGVQEYQEDEILKDLKKRGKWIDGVVITGGEPTLQPDLPEFIEKLKKLGFEVMIETNGSRPDVLKKIVNYKFLILNYLSIDFKVPFEKYNLVNGNGEKVKQSLEIIVKSQIPFEIRTTVVPGIHDLKVLLKMANELKSLIVNCKLKIENCVWFLQNFQPKNCLDPKFNQIKPFKPQELEKLVVTLKKIIPTVKLRD